MSSRVLRIRAVLAMLDSDRAKALGTSLVGCLGGIATFLAMVMPVLPLERDALTVMQLRLQNGPWGEAATINAFIDGPRIQFVNSATGSIVKYGFVDSDAGLQVSGLSSSVEFVIPVSKQTVNDWDFIHLDPFRNEDLTGKKLTETDSPVQNLPTDYYSDVRIAGKDGLVMVRTSDRRVESYRDLRKLAPTERNHRLEELRRKLTNEEFLLVVEKLRLDYYKQLRSSPQ